MDLQTILGSLQGILSDTMPMLLAALSILIVGWLIAVVLRAGTRRLLDMVDLNERIRTSTEREIDAESMGAAGVFWLTMLLVLIAFLN
ncbi:MAG: hypothetical protein OEM63_06965, partial [Gammaproteobacteria bacterium]|nr:hypothetical protein [Gammaproteobacteria bacterium]